jgi:hypothetical protein
MNPSHELLGQYRTALNRIQLAYASLVLWSHPDIVTVFDAIYDKLDLRLRPFPKVGQLVRDDATMRIACEELYEMAFRSALNDLLPLTKSYCHATGQIDKLKSQSWFPFWRVLRNCFSHDMKFNFNPAERTLLPITWSGCTIDIAMNGKALPLVSA